VTIIKTAINYVLSEDIWCGDVMQLLKPAELSYSRTFIFLVNVMKIFNPARAL